MTTVQSSPGDKATPAPARRRAWLIVGGIATGVVMLLAVAAAGGKIWSALTPERSEGDAAVYAAPVSGVQIDVEVGQVNLNASTGPDLEVSRETTWQGTEPETPEQWRADGTFEARADCGSGGWLRDRPESCAVDYEIALPPGAAAEVRTSFGNVSATGLDGVVDLRTGMGDIDARGLRSTDTTVETSAGGIGLSFAEVLSDIEAGSDVGSIVVTVPADGMTYHVDADTGIGDSAIDIDTVPAAEADYTITVETRIGDLRIQYAP
ncbi:DUF4097 family beta strand repeat-containing protein [Glycomyces buryatensis]|uniref:DUF4097 domain-containing protein n=1 Tax=Glycomyces buryatensis TaxID=2570927 RepID=A0A4S8Q8T8_9ACTN|nr:DUF4097 family beta strand repeat-containing protein [Glycomyces buryatensis]THV39821.1 DUF4097 domain-containing protein [Glycomyces buryatensis]